MSGPEKIKGERSFYGPRFIDLAAEVAAGRPMVGKAIRLDTGSGIIINAVVQFRQKLSNGRIRIHLKDHTYGTLTGS